MRLARCVLVAALLAGCDDETEAAPETVAEVSAVEPVAPVEPGEPIAAPLPEPVHGGAMVAVGALAVEACVRESGIVEGYLAGARAPAAREVALQMTVSSREGPQTIALAWDPGEARYRGAVVDPVEGPLEVSATHAGEVRVGHLPRVTPIPGETVASTRSAARPRAPAPAREPTPVVPPAPAPPPPVEPTPPAAAVTEPATEPTAAPPTGRRRVAPVQQNR